MNINRAIQLLIYLSSANSVWANRTLLMEKPTEAILRDAREACVRKIDEAIFAIREHHQMGKA